MTLREGSQALGAQRLGNVAYALHEGLCQSIPPGPGQEPVIRVFPAWPVEWDAEFTLLCRNGFLVTASMREGKVGFVEVHSRDGGTCRLRNPWGNDPIRVYRDGKRQEDVDGSMVTVDTDAGEDIVIVPSGASPEQRRLTGCSE
ncbi:glycoside hydrolase family 95-like protein [Haladaptatus pallidirubidus]|uniref:glycoside hydrolase family 95-like protein n=1 Tax=Haladaptatus pallidirubidus TaxID=1008152 RepID=UPI0034A193E3